MLLAFLLVAKTFLFGQTRELSFERLPLDRGTGDYRAFDVAQDSIGFIWIATPDGLYRYDGIDYKVFRPRLNDTSGVSSSTIWCLTTDRRGLLWIGTFDGGLDCFNPQTEVFTHYRNDPEDPTSLSRGPITAIFEDHTGGLWIGTESAGLCLFDRARGTFVRFVRRPGDVRSLSNNSVRAICEDPSGVLWVGTEDGLCALNRERGTFKRYTYVPGHPHSLSGKAVSCLSCDPLGALWVGTRDKGLNKFDRHSGSFIQYRRRPADSRTISSDSITSIYQHDDRYLWIGTQAGLNRLDKTTGLCDRYLNDPLDPNSLIDDYVMKVTGDRTGTIWIATDNFARVGSSAGGVCKVMRKSQQFVHYQLPYAAGTLQDVKALYPEPSSNVLWLGTGAGLRQFNSLNGNVVEYRHRKGSANSLSNDLVSAILVDRSGVMWVGTWLGGLNRFDRIAGRFVTYLWNPGNSPKGNAVISLSEDQPAPGSADDSLVSLWIGAFRGGLLHFSASTGKFVQYLNDPSDPGSLSNDRVITTYVDRKGGLWVGTDGGGLNRFDRSTGTFLHYMHDDSDPRSLRSNRVFAICEDRASYSGGGALLWVGSATGIDRFDVDHASASHYVLEDSLSSFAISGIIPDRENLWIITERNGLFQLFPLTGKSRRYTAGEGLHSDKLTRAFCRTTSGVIMFGSEGGFDAFYPDSIRDNTIPPPVAITSFSVFEKPFDLGRPLWTSPLIHLNFDQDFFSFRFVALDFTASMRNQFAYKLEGFDKDWNFPGTRNFAGYTKVDPGEYVFRVRASNSDGVWNESGASVRLVIEPPYWRTWWFRLFAGVAVLGILAAAYNYRVSKLLEVQRMRIRIASDLHDDIGSSLSGIALITESVRAGLPPAAQDRDRLADVTDAARRTADSLKDIVWIVNPEHDKMGDIVLRMKDTAAKILIGLDYTINCKEHAMSSKLDMEFRRHLILMFKEILNNIVKHAHASKVEISMGDREGTFFLSVTDDGAGFDETTIRRGNGLNNLQKRASQVGGAVRIESSPGHGTTVDFRAPIL